MGEGISLTPPLNVEVPVWTGVEQVASVFA